ncbi:hypothetical protein [Glutamicibacter sp. JC586]|uniref:hypothetical protein n=1 Tax=Glutamicibacter sp. JC586 TaxID=2590552 RepID=UPI0013594683|nr:hypothetical protein [Glutamicibacter sp. JC586]
MKVKNEGLFEFKSSKLNLFLSFDGGFYLNWKTSKPIQSLSLLSSDSGEIYYDFSDFHSDDLSFGVIDLSRVKSEEYQVVINGVMQEFEIVNSIPAEFPIRTKNQGATEEHIWKLRHSDDGKILLCPLAKKEMRPAVVALDAGLGIVVVEVSPVPLNSDHQLVLRNRKNKKEFVRVPVDLCDESRRRFVINIDVWENMRIPLNGGKTVWDLFVSEDDKLAESKRLGWRGSSTANPRETVRFRATSSWAKRNRLYRIRPYWTLDQLLALEISQFSNPEGSYR